MAPIDRREHRQQRVRGAGPSAVQASFGFNFGALGARSAKQSSLPPQRSSRRTPVQSTPRGANGSAKRHRSASVKRSGSSKSKPTPKDNLVTPQLGKRKRGSSRARPGSDDGEEDELSPDHEELVRSIEQSRRVVGTISPIHEEVDEAPDELSILDGSATIATKSFLGASATPNGTPLSLLAPKRALSAAGPQKSPLAGPLGSTPAFSRQSISQRSKSTDPDPSTPAVLTNGQPRLSASRLDPEFKTPSSAVVDEESEDELSPPQVNGTTPRIVGKDLQPQTGVRDEDGIDVDELSTPPQLTPSLVATAAFNNSELTVSQPPKRGRPRQIVEDDEEDEAVAATPNPSIARSRPRKVFETKEAAAESKPVTQRRTKRRKQEAIVEDEEDVDELSPETQRTTRRLESNGVRKENVAKGSDVEDSDAYEDPAPEDEPGPTSQPMARRTAPKSIQRPKTSIEKPQYKRPKFSGPKHAISVMRIKGSTVRGITVADTTRTILEESIDHRLNRMVEKMQKSSNSVQRKELRSEINLSLSFKESLDEKLLDLQDANDVLSINFKKMKLFKRDNVDLRKEILALQNTRQEIALEHDDIQAVFEAEKEKMEARSTLNANMFDIEAAIQNGRKKARKEGREDEGPHIPLNMLLENVGRKVGSFGGGLLSNVKAFNGALERAAGWLEGRA